MSSTILSLPSTFVPGVLLDLDLPLPPLRLPLSLGRPPLLRGHRRPRIRHGLLPRVRGSSPDSAAAAARRAAQGQRTQEEEEVQGGRQGQGHLLRARGGPGARYYLVSTIRQCSFVSIVNLFLFLFLTFKCHFFMSVLLKVSPDGAIDDE